MKRSKHIEARNQKFIDQALRIQRARNGQGVGVRGQESEVIYDQPTLSQPIQQTAILQPPRPEPYHAKTNPPRKGDRVRTGQGKTGEITEVRTTNPKYTILWENDREGHYSFTDLEVLDVRKEN
jgi:hypothetical protein